MDPFTITFGILAALFFFSASCYVLFISSDPLEEVGGKIGRLLRLPEDVIASTFQALATSGPEIMMAILAAGALAGGFLGEWPGLEMAEKGSSGTINMIGSSMDNLLGIGAVAIFFMIKFGMVNRDETIKLELSSKIGLVFYTLSSGLLAFYILDGSLSVVESWTLMAITIAFIGMQFIMPKISTWFGNGNGAAEEDENDGDGEPVPPMFTGAWSKSLAINVMIYSFLVYLLIVFVKIAMGATFDMATLGIASVAGIIIMFTSYVSSFPEFMMTYRFAIANKRDALLGMLFGSNVIDLGFAGFRAIYRGESMEVYTTGAMPELLPFYVFTLPVIALFVFVGTWLGFLKYSIVKPAIVFYVIYIISSFILL